MPLKPLFDYWLATISELWALVPEPFCERELMKLTIQLNLDLRPTMIEMAFAVRRADANPIGI